MQEHELENKDTFGYQWVRKSTGEFYRGIHTGDPEDNYAGGGALFNKKFGGKYKNSCKDKEDWVRDVLFIGTRDECCIWESLVVTQREVDNPKCLNLIVGGQNGAVGYSHTEDTKQAISKKLKGKEVSTETKDLISKANKGRQFTPEQRGRMSEAAKKRKPLTEETRRKLSEATKAYWAKRKETTMEGEVDVK